MSVLRKFVKLITFDEDTPTDRWVLRCEKCGELLATNKPYLIRSHKNWCRI